MFYFLVLFLVSKSYNFYLAEKSVTDLAEEGEGEETTGKVEEFEPTDTESKLMIEEEGSTEALSAQEMKEHTQTSESSGNKIFNSIISHDINGQLLIFESYFFHLNFSYISKLFRSSFYCH